MGIWSCLGTSLDEVRQSLYDGKSGIVFSQERKDAGFRSALCANVYMIISIILQSLNEYKLVYKVALTGFVLNALFDIPWMLLFHHIGLEGFIGSIVSSIFGFSISVVIGLFGLRRISKDINFKQLFKWFTKTLLVGLCMLVPLLLINKFNLFDVTVTGQALMKIGLYLLIGAPIYIFLSFKMHLIDDLLGKEMYNKILRKVTFGKLGK